MTSAGRLDLVIRIAALLDASGVAYVLGGSLAAERLGLLDLLLAAIDEAGSG